MNHLVCLPTIYKVAVFALLLTSFPSKAISPCDVALGGIRGVGNTSIVLAKGVGHIIKGATYAPIVLPIKLIAKTASRAFFNRDGAKRWRDIPVELFKEDKFHGLGWLIMKGLQGMTGLTFSQFEQLTSEFVEEEEEDFRVIVDLFPPKAEDAGETAGGVEHYHRIKSKGKDNIHYIKADSFADAMKKTDELAKKMGKKITHLDLFYHGAIGVIRFGHKNYYLDFKDQKFYDKPEPWGDDKKKTKFAEGAPNYLGKSLSDVPNFDFMAKDALVRWTGCFVQNSEEGKIAMNILNRKILGKRGGHYFVTKVPIIANPIEIIALTTDLMDEPPEWLRWYGDQLAAVYLFPTLNNGRRHRWTRYPDVKATGPFHFNRVEKVEIKASTSTGR